VCTQFSENITVGPLPYQVPVEVTQRGREPVRVLDLPLAPFASTDAQTITAFARRHTCFKNTRRMYPLHGHRTAAIKQQSHRIRPRLKGPDNTLTRLAVNPEQRKRVSVPASGQGIQC
jgi:hypothetical protein